MERRLTRATRQRVAISRPHGRGVLLVKLHDEVRTCGYEDVQVMWEMLQRSAADLAGARRSKRSSSSRPPSFAGRLVPQPVDVNVVAVVPCMEIKDV
ncbi:hypothetical protein Cni_G17316 [Canna indica]|uniref:Uncharacterized protein n=1 Tax=Canna indica TaxID=4628 RepID=A0AAQ3QGM8_9LILI|nr:hypothetical protein Cni_G17316 [Canna indica]